MKRYYIQYRGYQNGFVYRMIDRYYNESIAQGSKEEMNILADKLGDVEDSIEY